MSVPVVALFLARPGCEARIEELFRGVIDTTLAEEGCISYQLNRAQDEPRRFVWTEEWASRELLDRHLQASHIVELFKQVPDLVESSAVIALDKVAGGAA